MFPPYSIETIHLSFYDYQMGLPSSADLAEAYRMAEENDCVDLSEVDANGDVVAQCYQQIFDKIRCSLEDDDSDYITQNYYVYANFLDSSITYEYLDMERLEKIYEGMDAGEVKDLFEEHFLCF